MTNLTAEPARVNRASSPQLLTALGITPDGKCAPEAPARRRPLPHLAPLPAFQMAPMPSPTLASPNTPPQAQEIDLTLTARRRRGKRGGRAVREHWETRMGRILELLRTQPECCLCDRPLKFAGGSWKNCPVLSQKLDMLVCRGCAHNAKEAGPATDDGPKLNTVPESQRNPDRKPRGIDPADVVALRRERVAELHQRGYGVSQIAQLLAANPSHISNDLVKLGLQRKRTVENAGAEPAPETAIMIDAVLIDGRLIINPESRLAPLQEAPEQVAAAQSEPMVEPPAELAGNDTASLSEPTPEMEIAIEAVEQSPEVQAEPHAPRRRATVAVIAARRERVLELSQQGLPVAEIAAALGITHRAVYNDIAALGSRCWPTPQTLVAPAREAEPRAAFDPEAAPPECDAEEKEALDASEPDWPSRYEPTPEEIAAECKAIQADWHPSEFARRAKGILPNSTSGRLEVKARRARVARMKRDGKRNDEIAFAMGISISTVGTDIANLGLQASRRRKPQLLAVPTGMEGGAE